MLLGPTKDRFTRSLVAVAAAAALTGCGSSVTSSNEFRSAELSQEISTALRQLNYPFGEDPAYAIQMANLQSRLIADCVRENGLVMPEPAPEKLEPSRHLVPSEIELWVTAMDDLGTAVALSDPELIAELQAPPSNQEPNAIAVPPGYDEIVYGTDDAGWVEFPLDGGGTVQRPIAGCFGKATEAMYGVSAVEYERAYMEMPKIDAIMAEMRGAESLAPHVQAYSRCMKDAGLGVATPSAIGTLVQPAIEGVVSGEVRLADLQEREEEIARADGACKESSGLGTAAGEHFVDAATKELKEREGVVQEYRSYIENSRTALVEKGE
ncbi:hypothetical protein [Oerskovia sp. KBS0722]|uniref:hypothetical protein n=1 Tax=Oerskovia sp. KBS0722 TaxID=1179673 RepID=UPI0011A8A355|nr:hypothetical protein [Oerskovia sp. KBS0722]QDW62203.1 hypothetical protein FFI11_006340 [Oerskovia sp. KBS0722]